MNIDVKFEELSQEVKADFGEVQTASDGGYERGYAEGYERGEQAGYGKGESAGYSKGHEDGYAAGYADWYTEIDGVSLMDGTLEHIYSEQLESVRAFAYYLNRNLKTLTIPNVTYLSNNAFQGCTGLHSVKLGKVSTITTNVFRQCSALACVVISVDKVCTLQAVNSFQGTPIESGTGYIYVPDSLVDSYKSATNWSTYAAQIKPLSEYVEQE